MDLPTPRPRPVFDASIPPRPHARWALVTPRAALPIHAVRGRSTEPSSHGARGNP
ncbi:hypothetical protein ACN20G_01230 [Streptomyces sp. BI20]|uniref:hypothetical protein n=1 Tax=Streptomyces sp. BI20 TaxID=3403460 RepID=UPI003C75F96C